MNLLFRILTPLVIVVGALLLARHLIASKPEPKTFSMPPQITKVEATRLKPTSYQVYLDSQGTIRPRTTTTLVPEVTGRIVEVSPNFRDGGFFEKDEVLLRLEKVDYETALVVAETGVAESERALQEEKIRADQALENWRRLGKGGNPSDFVLRKPQLAEAEARLRAANAQVKQAKRDLERTDLKAPFAGRIVEQMVDVGQFVSQNTELGRAFATDIMEVRLPLTNRYLSFVELPSPGATAGPDVLITGKIGRTSEQWQGRVVRVDSSIDEASRQLFVVAEIKDPYHLRSGEASPLLKIGMFVDALVKGQELQNVFVLPRKAVRVGGEVIVIDSENKIERRQVDPIWSEDEKVIIAAGEGGLNAGEVVCLTPLAYPANGAPVLPTIDGITPEVEQPSGGPGMGYGKKGTKGKDGKGRKGEGKSSKEPQRS